MFLLFHIDNNKKIKKNDWIWKGQNKEKVKKDPSRGYLTSLTISFFYPLGTTVQ